jgi:hypothetical protein
MLLDAFLPMDGTPIGFFNILGIVSEPTHRQYLPRVIREEERAVHVNTRNAVMGE